MFAVLRRSPRCAEPTGRIRQRLLPGDAVRTSARRIRPDGDTRLLQSAVCDVFVRTVKPDCDRTSPRWFCILLGRDLGHMKTGFEGLEWALRFIPFVTQRKWTIRAESGGPNDLRDRAAVH